MSDDTIEVGEIYSLDELPDNEMHNSGKVEMVGDGKLALEHNGKMYEFQIAAECTAVTKYEDGEVIVLDGEPQ
jgi:hypothetical protein